MTAFAKALLALGVLGGLCLPVGLDASTIRDENRLFQAGRYEEAAHAASHVHLLRHWLQPQLRRQLDGLADGGVGDAMPVLMAAAAADTELRQRIDDARRAIDPTRLALADVKVSYDQPPAPASPDDSTLRFRAQEAADGDTSPWGSPFALERQDAQGKWVSLGTGFAGPLGSSFETTPHGRTLWLAREGEHTLECWDLVAGTSRSVTVSGAPGLVAIAPHDPDRVAYSLGSDQGDTLWLSDHGRQRQLYPAPGANGTPPMGFEWSDDGKSLLVDWEEQDPGGKPNTQVVWLRPDGTVGLEATLDERAEDFEPVWIAAPAGDRMGLALGEGSWTWASTEAKALPLDGATGVWGFDPTGRAIAGVDGGQLYVMDVGTPTKHFAQALPQLPAAFEGDPNSFHWKRDARNDDLSFAGAVPNGDGSARPVAITIRLSERP